MMLLPYIVLGLGLYSLLLPGHAGPADVEDAQPGPAPSLSFTSVGSTRPYFGAVDSPDAFKDALDACSFRGELIMIPTTDTHLDAAFQTLEMLRWGMVGGEGHSFHPPQGPSPNPWAPFGLLPPHPAGHDS